MINRITSYNIDLHFDVLELQNHCCQKVADQPETDRYHSGIDLSRPTIGRMIGRSVWNLELVYQWFRLQSTETDRNPLRSVARSVSAQETLEPSPGIGRSYCGLGRSDLRPVA